MVGVGMHVQFTELIENEEALDRKHRILTKKAYANHKSRRPTPHKFLLIIIILGVDMCRFCLDVPS